MVVTFYCEGWHLIALLKAMNKLSCLLKSTWSSSWGSSRFWPYWSVWHFSLSSHLTSSSSFTRAWLQQWSRFIILMRQITFSCFPDSSLRPCDSYQHVAYLGQIIILSIENDGAKPALISCILDSWWNEIMFHANHRERVEKKSWQIKLEIWSPFAVKKWNHESTNYNWA